MNVEEFLANPEKNLNIFLQTIDQVQDLETLEKVEAEIKKGSEKNEKLLEEKYGIYCYASCGKYHADKVVNALQKVFVKLYERYKEVRALLEQRYLAEGSKLPDCRTQAGKQIILLLNIKVDVEDYLHIGASELSRKINAKVPLTVKNPKNLNNNTTGAFIPYWTYCPEDATKRNDQYKTPNWFLQAQNMTEAQIDRLISELYKLEGWT